MGTENGAQREIFFISFVGSQYSRSSTLLNINSKTTLKIYRQVRSRTIPMVCDLIKIRREISRSSQILIMSPCQKITFIARVILSRKIYLDAGWPLTDGVISRGIKFGNIPRLLQLFLLDLVSFHSAKISFVETQAQLNRIHRLFGVPKTKMRVIFTGLNEIPFKGKYIQSSRVIETHDWISKYKFGTIVIFRGRINNEAGLEIILEAAKEVESKIGFIFLIGSREFTHSIPENCRVIAETTFDEMRSFYELADIALGQISRNPRIHFSIPHKAFEAGYFAKCYVSMRTKSILELYKEGDVYFLEEANAPNLVSALTKLSFVEARRPFERRIKARYEQVTSQEMLAMNVESEIFRYHPK